MAKHVLAQFRTAEMDCKVKSDVMGGYGMTSHVVFVRPNSS